MIGVSAQELIVPDEVILDALIQAGFNESEATTMLAVALAESGGDTNARNQDGEDSRGLFQIHVGANTDLRGMNLYDPYEGAKAAKIVYDRQTISAWTVTHGNQNARYLEYANRALTSSRDLGFANVRPNFQGVGGYKDKASAVLSPAEYATTTSPVIDPEYNYALNDDDPYVRGAAILADWKNTFYGSLQLVGEIGEADIEVQDAWQIAKQMLEDYGLSELFPEIESALLKGLSAEAAVGRIRETQAFKDRFAGLQGRVDNGYNAISPATYLSYEDNIRNLMVEAGFSPGFYDEPEDLAQFIANDVRPDEIADRIKLAQRAVMDADPLVKAEIQERFGIGLDTESDLVSYFLDPERAVPILEMKSQVGVAELGAATQRAMGTGRTLQTETAQNLVRRGYSAREIGERLKGRGGMTQRMLGEGRGISATEVAAAEFGLDSEAVANVRRLRQDRQQRGSRTSGAMVSQAGVTGLGAVNT